MCPENKGGDADLRADISEAVSVLEKGGIILCPTDTVWGLSCDATNAEAVARLIKLKARKPDQGFIVLMTELMYRRYFRVLPPFTWDLIDNCKDALTLVLPESRGLARGVCSSDGFLAVRRIDHPFCTPLVKDFGRPLVSTSANPTGEKTPFQFDDVSEIIHNGVDCIINAKYDSSVVKAPSQMIRLEYNGEISFIR